MSTATVNGGTAAEREARGNWERNCVAMAEVGVKVNEMRIDVEWVYARDGSLTGMDGEGRFVGGCSVPRRAAEEMLRKMKVSGGVVCLLRPTHARQVEVALEMLGKGRAAMVVAPDDKALRMMLHCCDFSAAIRGHRVWFAGGVEWEKELERVFQERPGLPLPQQFVRTVELKEEEGAGMMAAAKRVFERVGQERAKMRAELLAEGMETGKRRNGETEKGSVGEGICVVAGSGFRLWEDAGAVLAAIIEESGNVVRLDTDDPSSSGSLGLLVGSRGCETVVAANATRAELGEAVRRDVRMVSWMTAPAIPEFRKGMERDGLLVADERWVEVARRMGWPAARVGVAGWPAEERNGETEKRRNGGGYLAIVADTGDVRNPGEFELSSHRLLWEGIAGELLGGPFAIGGDVEGYLRKRMAKAGVGEEGLDRRRFVEDLIVPAYGQGLVKVLMAAGVGVKVYGKGWEGMAEFREVAGGEIKSRQQLREVARGAAGLVHVWPWGWAHPVEAMGKGVVRGWGKGRAEFVGEARAVLMGKGKGVAATRRLTREVIMGMVG